MPKSIGCQIHEIEAAADLDIVVRVTIVDEFSALYRQAVGTNAFVIHHVLCLDPKNLCTTAKKRIFAFGNNKILRNLLYIARELPLSGFIFTFPCARSGGFQRRSIRDGC